MLKRGEHIEDISAGLKDVMKRAQPRRNFSKACQKVTGRAICDRAAIRIIHRNGDHGLRQIELSDRYRKKKCEDVSKIRIDYCWRIILAP